MPDLAHEQFKDIRFRVYHDPKADTIAVAAHVKPGDPLSVTPLGSLTITHPTYQRSESERQQRAINLSTHDEVGERRKDFLPSRTHTIEPDKTGQMQWRGGNMERHLSEVGWAGVRNVPGKGRIIQGLAALAVAASGSMPMADSALSQHGARLARGMARKYGMEGHPQNQEMGAGFEYDPTESERTSKAEAVGYWRTSEHDTGYDPNSWSEHSAADVAHIVRGVDTDYRVQQRPDRVPVHRDQGKLF